MADLREPIETGSPDPFQYMHPTMRRNFGMWKYHTHPQPGVLLHVADHGDKLWTVKAGTQRILDVFSMRTLCDIADNYSDGFIRFTIRSNPEFYVTEESRVQPLIDALEGAGFVYTIEGQPLENIYYLLSGHAEAELPDGSTVKVPQGNVIGEVSYRLQCPASATVTGSESCMSLRWNQQELREMCSKHINIKRAVDNVLSSHMARKLSDSTDDRQATDKPVVEAG